MKKLIAIALLAIAGFQLAASPAANETPAGAALARARENQNTDEVCSDISARIVCKFTDNKTETKTIPITRKNGVGHLLIPKNSIPSGLQSIDVHHPFASAKTGEDGFYVFSNGLLGTFKKCPDGDYRTANARMPMFGVRTPRGAMTVVLRGMRYEAEHCVSLKNGDYTVFPRYILDGEKPYDDISIEFHYLPATASYSDMAKAYRKLQLDAGICRPLKERVKERAELAYASQAPEVRVRMAWKPVPPSVLEQTADNEPPMTVRITFDRFMQLVDEFKRQGIDKAQFCLVGWNIRGHDGRYPQIFPVEEALGGETKLREAIQHAQTAGYQIVCHTNNSDAYRAAAIGGLWDEAYLLRRKDGGFANHEAWSGGTMHWTCPQAMFERFVKSDHAKLKDIGFRGIHYIDVYSTVSPRVCHSPEHPLNKEEYASWVRKILANAQREFGGVASEGGHDYCISNLDYALSVTFLKPDPGMKMHPLMDRHVPFWHLVYNGIVLNNPFRGTVNYTIQDAPVRLKLIEFGGRPLFYLHSLFTNTKDAFGNLDLTVTTDADLVETVRKIKEGCDEFERLKHLQLEFMESHEPIAENVFQTTFSDGTRILTNYRGTDYKHGKQTVKPQSYIILTNP